ncbi:hypothetical protein [Spirosoma pollinicola]|uniref:Uncharacterized protein n=1 Tax=Spirosoma pollinicola TaxID=2057025 RepID=A0A2K8YTH9_9BACT|nr:hypothetical protein [Spirosoma pollinicola]AUD00931.1 hypothetical protein CWM47_03335 [Spirosoma pollinicola]
MRTSTILFAFLLFTFMINEKCFSQKLEYSSNGFGFTKGTINTEILSDIIAAKQEEVQIRIFKNLIINNFIKSSDKEKNFVLYYYIYNTMRNLTLEKNKKIITQKTTNSLIEFALVYSYTAALLEKYGDPKNPDHVDFIDNLQIIAKIDNDQKIPTNEKLVISDLLLVETNKNINFSLASSEFLNEQFNQIKKDPAKTNEANKNQVEQQQVQYQQQQSQIQQQKEVISNKNKSLSNKAFTKQYLINFLIDFSFDYLRASKTFTDKKLFVSSLRNEDNFKSWWKSDSKFKRLYNTDEKETNIKATPEYIGLFKNMEELTAQIFTGKIGELNNFAFYISRIYILVSGLESDGFDINKLDKKQYDNYKQLLINLISLLRQTDLNNTAANVINFTLDYTLIEYKEATPSESGVLYVDIESLIQALDQKYNNIARKSSIGHLALVPRPYFNIGINDGLFLYNNQLSENKTNLKNIYLASEKIGLRVKVADWKYVNSFQPGETYRFWGTYYTTLIPRKEPLIADMYFSIYASGVLYNVANLRTDSNFSSGFIGANVGLTFFNGLGFNLGLARPFNTNLYKRENTFVTLSFDIPIIEYIVAARKKK